MLQSTIRPIIVFLLAAALVLAQNSAQDSSSVADHTSTGAYFYIYRTPSHIRYSSSSVFYQVSTRISEYLAAKHVVVVKVKENDSATQTLAGDNLNITPGEGTANLPVPDLLKDARAAGASHLLVLAVDRPFTSWVTFKLQCLDLSGNVLWQETASSGVTPLTGSQGLKIALQRLAKRLDTRIGQPGLALQNDKLVAPTQMIAANSEKDNRADAEFKDKATIPYEQPTAESQQDAVAREETVVLPTGTSVRVMLASPVDSTRAKAGDTLEFRVLDDVKVGNLVVIPRKAAASGSVTAVVPPKRRQQPGSITIRMETVSLLNHQTASLRGVWTIRSGNKNLAIENNGDTTDLIQSTGGFGVFFLPLFMLKHGESVVLPAGMQLTAEIEDSVAIESEALLQAQPPPAIKRHGNPVVTVYHFSNPPTDRPKFYCGKVEVAQLQDGTAFQLTLPPGEYWFRSHSRKYAVHLTLEEGGEYYLRVDSVMTWGNRDNPGYSQFVRVRHQDIAEIETAAASPLDPKYIKEISKVDPALLLAPK